MGRIKLLHALTFLITLILIMQPAVGLCRRFMTGRGADQSRPSAMWQVPLAVAIGAFLFSVALPWIPITGWAKAESTVQSQFKLRSVFILMAGVAVAIAIGMRAPMIVASFCFSLALVAAVRSAILIQSGASIPPSSRA